MPLRWKGNRSVELKGVTMLTIEKAASATARKVTTR